jgi:hypothetical protein
MTGAYGRKKKLLSRISLRGVAAPAEAGAGSRYPCLLRPLYLSACPPCPAPHGTMAHIMPASWQHWSKTLQSSKHTFKASGKVHTSKTLFLAQVPSHAGTEELQALAKPLPGYVPFSARRVRCAPFSSPFPAVTTPRAPAPTARWKHHTAVCVRGSPDRCLRLPLLAASSSGMAFLDFESKQHATDALSKLQGHTWKAGEKGLLVSYDKDDEEDRGGTARRQMEELRRRREELEASYTRLHCAACGSFACKVVVDLEKLPLRRTDGSRVVGSAQLMALDCAKGAAKKIKREKGIEKQYYLNCVQCDVTLAYRSTPFGTPGKYVYLIAKALRARTTEEGKRDRCARPPSLPSWIDTVHATRPPPPPPRHHFSAPRYGPARCSAHPRRVSERVHTHAYR